jgi:hypothetical protein
VVALIKLSYEIASGAQVSYTDDTSINTSDGAISGRISPHPVVREYMLSVNPAQSGQIVHSVMALRGKRYAFVLRDYADNYQLTNEVLPHTGTVALLGKTWKPTTFVDTDTGGETTGSLSVFERILIPDTKDRPFVVKVNGSVPSPDSHTFSDFGRINIPGLTSGDTVTVTGDYLTAVTYVDDPSTTIITNGNGQTLHRFSDMRLRQIFENELVKLTA